MRIHPRLHPVDRGVDVCRPPAGWRLPTATSRRSHYRPVRPDGRRRPSALRAATLFPPKLALAWPRVRWTKPIRHRNEAPGRRRLRLHRPHPTRSKLDRAKAGDRCRPERPAPTGKLPRRPSARRGLWCRLAVSGGGRSNRRRRSRSATRPPVPKRPPGPDCGGPNATIVRRATPAGHESAYSPENAPGLPPDPTPPDSDSKAPGPGISARSSPDPAVLPGRFSSAAPVRDRFAGREARRPYPPAPGGG